jgi:deoxyribodipyrimidine photolyase-related protein
MDLQIILGNQLFAYQHYKNAPKNIFMCEDYDLCTHFRYHKHKIIFFLASMRKFSEELKNKGHEVHYFKLEKKKAFFKNLESIIKKNKLKTIFIYEVEDKFFETKIFDFCEKNKVVLKVQQSPMFMVSRDDFKNYNQNVKKPFMKTFYEELRNKTGLLMDDLSQPVGGKYSFDAENRKKIPKKFDVIQSKIENKSDEIIDEVKKLVDQHFADHSGKSSDFWMATTRSEAFGCLNNFVKLKLELFGDYEDALDQRDPFLYHSVLSPYINIGFLTPKEVLQEITNAKVPLNSKEGFVRQVLGWREFMRGIYQEYSVDQDKRNFFNHHKKLTKDWYQATTGIPPLDDAIVKVLRFGYNHHIERLMVISNLMLLCEINPKEVYAWFMEMYVDSSDWVMGPNVYGMAQFSDGGIFATKPYISGSNYISKMGHYKKGEWCDIWDGLYWQFIDKHQEFFKKNYRMSMMVKMLAKMDSEKKKRLYLAADKFKKVMTK